MANQQRIDAGQLQLKDTVVSINRVTKVVKGGKNLSFSALVVVGDESGHVGNHPDPKGLAGVHPCNSSSIHSNSLIW